MRYVCSMLYVTYAIYALYESLDPHIELFEGRTKEGKKKVDPFDTFTFFDTSTL